jgi:hypothetical protein
MGRTLLAVECVMVGSKHLFNGCKFCQVHFTAEGNVIFLRLHEVQCEVGWYSVTMYLIFCTMWQHVICSHTCKIIVLDTIQMNVNYI